MGREIARVALQWPEIQRLMTVPGVNVMTAATFMASVGHIHRFSTPRKLVSYLGLDPRMRQQATRRHATAGSPKPARPRPATCSARPPGEWS